MRARLYAGCLAAAGVVAAHALAYASVAPDPHAHQALLAETGHGYWHYVVALALGALVGGLATFVREGAPHFPLRHMIVRLSLLQVGAFGFLEAAERYVSGGEVGALLAEPAVQLGFALQIVVAFAAAMLLHALHRGLVRLTRGAGPLRVRALALPLPCNSRSPLTARPGRDSNAVRGPPPTVAIFRP